MDAAGLFLYACAIVLVTIVNNACAIPITCEQLCSRVTDKQSEIYRVCACDVMTLDKRQITDSVLREFLKTLHLEHTHHHHTHHVEKTTTPLMTSTTYLTTTTRQIVTTDVCVILCAAQLGGRACECSKPGFPGRK